MVVLKRDFQVVLPPEHYRRFLRAQDEGVGFFLVGTLDHAEGDLHCVVGLPGYVLHVEEVAAELDKHADYEYLALQDFDVGAGGAADVFDGEHSVLEDHFGMVPTDILFEDEDLVAGVTAYLGAYVTDAVEVVELALERLEDELMLDFFLEALLGLKVIEGRLGDLARVGDGGVEELVIVDLIKVLRLNRGILGDCKLLILLEAGTLAEKVAVFLEALVQPIKNLLFDNALCDAQFLLQFLLRELVEHRPVNGLVSELLLQLREADET